MQSLFEILNEETEKEKTPKQERNYWIREIHDYVKKYKPKVTEKGIAWRINLGLKPCKTSDLRDFHFKCKRLASERNNYKNYAHVFYALTKVKLLDNNKNHDKH